MATAVREYEILKVWITTKDKDDHRLICSKINHTAEYVEFTGVLQLDSFNYEIGEDTSLTVFKGIIRTIFTKREYKTYEELKKELDK